MNGLKYLIIGLIVLIFTGVWYFQTSINKLEEENRLAASEFDDYRIKTQGDINDLSNEVGECQQTNQKLTSDIGKYQFEKTQLEKGNQELQKKVDIIKTELSGFEAEISSSLSWFGENYQLGEGYYEDRIKRDLTNNCIDKKEGRCYLKTSCPYFVNKQYSNFKYLGDRFTSNATDRIQSLKEFIDHNGGDCEDYALFYKAEWNYLLAQCEGMPITVESYVEGSADYFVTYRESWYIKSKEPVYLSLGRVKPVIVCGNIYDLNSANVNGHCAIALTGESVDLISSLDGAIIIEPQNGMYNGELNDKSSGIYVLESGMALPESYIYMVITDTDLYLFDNNRWRSYTSFLGEIREMRESLVGEMTYPLLLK